MKTPEARLQELKQLDVLKQEHIALMDLVNRPGWKLVCAEFKKAADHAYAQMISSDNAHQAAKHMGAFHACENIHRWPVAQLARLAHMIEIISKGK